MQKQETIDLLKSQLPGFYSVEQVIKMIEDIEDTKQSTLFTDGQISELVGDIVDGIDGEGMDLIDDYDFFSAGAKTAVDEFYSMNKNSYELTLPDSFMGHFAILKKIN